MTETKQQALNKMLEELNTKHSPGVDQIHNWICEQDDENLFTNILKDGKTIANAIQYAAGKARKNAMSGVAFATDEEVYQWIVEYFASDKTEVKPVARVQSTPAHRTDEEKAEIASKVQRTTETIIKKHEVQKKANKPEVLMNIFDFLDGPTKDPADFDPSDEARKLMSFDSDVDIDDDIDDEVTEDGETETDD